MVKKVAADSTATPKITPKSKISSRFNKLRLPAVNNKNAVVYVGHLPKGFNETELKKFFTQFGDVSKLRVSRSKKTARSRGYAFLEFKDREVAQVASQTMHGYMLFGRQLDCHLIDRPHRETFKNGNREWKFVPTQIKFRNTKNAEKTDVEKAARVRGLLEKEKEKRVRLRELGIDYEFDGYQGIIDKALKALEKVAKEEVKASVAAAAAPAAVPSSAKSSASKKAKK